MSAYATKFHRDGTVTVWNVYRQGWERTAAAEVEDRVLASLSEAERTRIEEDAMENHNETESTLTAQMRDDRMTVEDSAGGRWWPTDAGQAAIDAAEDPEEEAVRLAESHDRAMGEWRQ